MISNFTFRYLDLDVLLLVDLRTVKIIVKLMLKGTFLDHYK